MSIAPYSSFDQDFKLVQGGVGETIAITFFSPRAYHAS